MATPTSARAAREPARRRAAAVLVAATTTAVGACSGPPSDRSRAAQPAVAVAAAAPVTAAVIGDYGIDTTAEGQVASMVASWRPALVATVGDNYYSSVGETGTARYDRVVGKYYCAFLAGAASGTNCPSGGTSIANRFFPATGNHDYTDGGIDNYRSYFALPGTGTTSASPSGSELYYDVRQGPLHLFFIDSQAALRSPTSMSAQKTWLQNALAASDAPWKVVAFHHPAFSSSLHGSTTAMQWPFAAWGADLVLSGHDHSWERVESGGITYIVNGLGGARRYGFRSTSVTGSVSRYFADWGALRLSVDATTLTGTFVTVKGLVIDRFALTADGTTARLRDGAGSPTYAGTRDTTISQATPTAAFGSAATLRIDGDDPPGTGQDLSTLIRFDTTAIPAGATIIDASIRFRVVDPSASPYRAWPLLRSWAEAAATWRKATATTLWATPGAAGAADRSSPPIGVLSAPSSGTATLALDGRGVALVQGWVNGSIANRGLVVSGSTPIDGIDLAARHAATITQRPTLVITYRITAP